MAIFYQTIFNVKNVLFIILLIANVASGQIIEKWIKTESQFFKYNEDVIFAITKMREEPKGGFGAMPLRGYTSYVIYLIFKNRSDKTLWVDLEDIYLYNPESDEKFKVDWYNYAGVGAMSKSQFKIKPQRKRRFVLFYIYEINQDLYFLINDKSSKIKIIE